MKEHYVSYSQAVKLKELGFDWKCDRFYDGNKRLLESSIFSRTYRVSDYWHNFNEYDRDNHRQSLYVSCSAPRLDQAQAWLREHYGIYVSANPYSDYSKDADGRICDEWYFWSFELMRVPSGEFMDDANGEYKSYEQALCAGIDAALELLGKEVNNA